MKLITHGSERLHCLLFLWEGTLLGGNGQLGLQTGGSSMKFWSNGRGTRLLNL